MPARRNCSGTAALQYVAVVTGGPSLVSDGYAEALRRRYKTMEKHTGSLVVFSPALRHRVGRDAGRPAPVLPRFQALTEQHAFSICRNGPVGRPPEREHRRSCPLLLGRPVDGDDPYAGGDAQRGQQVFANNGCGWCHEGSGTAAGRGPPLAGTKRGNDFLATRIMNGKPGTYACVRRQLR